MDLDKDKYLRNLKGKSPDKWKLLGFARLPNKLVFEDKISAYAMLVFWNIKMHSFGKKDGFPAIPTISKEMKISQPTIKRALKELEKAKYIIPRRARGRRNIYEILI